MASLVEQAGGSQLFGNLTQADTVSCLRICPPPSLCHGNGLCKLLLELVGRLLVFLCQSLNTGLATLALALRLADALTRVSQLGDKASFFQLGKGAGDLAEWEETHKEMLTGLLKADKARAVKKKKERVAELETPTQEAAE